MDISPLHLSREQSARLLGYVQTYRRYALTQLAPSTERNTTQRLLQALQGKLIREMDQPSATCSLAVNAEEVKALQTMIRDLLHLTTREAGSDQRNAMLLDLAGLKSLVEKRSTSGQGRRYTQTLLQQHAADTIPESR